MWNVASAVQFKRALSWISTAAILGALAALASAILFANDRGLRIAAGLAILILAIIAKHAGRNFDAAPLRAAQTLEKVVYAVAIVGLLSGGYVIWANEELRSVPGLLLVLLQVLISIGAFVVVKTNIDEAKSFPPAGAED